jgi:GNAT superfamily N-acetyltransferase
MIDDWYTAIKLPLSLTQFHQLPRNAAYKYEYIEGDAWLSPRPKNGRAVLDLASFSPPVAEIAADEKITVRPLTKADWDGLPPLFAAAFIRVQPFASLADKDRLRAAEDCMRHTRQSGDGPVIEPACFVAAAGDELHGAILITRPDDDAVGDEPSRPHLTWIFVAPMTARQGVGAALLDAAVRELRRQGCRELRSTFLIGNESSTLWHWRAGFKLLENRWSWRAIRQEK